MIFPLINVRGSLILHHNLSWFMAFIIESAALFCSGDNVIQQSKTSFNSGVSSTISPSDNSCASDIPNAWLMVSSVAKDGIVFRRNILPIVVCAMLHSFDSHCCSESGRRPSNPCSRAPSEAFRANHRCCRRIWHCQRREIQSQTMGGRDITVEHRLPIPVN